MNKNTLKETLSAFRSGSPDHDDPVFQEALAQVEKDHDLKQWFNDSLKEDSTFRQNFNQSPVPEGLRDNILLQNAPPKILGFPGFRRSLTAIAAAILFATVVFTFIKGEGPASTLTAEEFVFKAFELEQHGHRSLDFVSSDRDEKIQWLAQGNAPTGWELPQPFQTAVAAGCSKVEFGNHPVSMICYRLPEGAMAHVYVIKRNALSKATPPGEIHFDQSGEFSSARWCDGEFYYIAVAKSTTQALANFLQ